jgi:hypothetical protein
LLPNIKNRLVTHAYTTFFRQTLANFEARYEGREIRLGRSWDPREGEPDTGAPERVLEGHLQVLLTRAAALAKNGWQSLGLSSSNQPRSWKQSWRMDEDGFAHSRRQEPVASSQRASAEENREPDSVALLYSTGTQVRTFLSDLAKAWQKDWGMLMSGFSRDLPRTRKKE